MAGCRCLRALRRREAVFESALTLGDPNVYSRLGRRDILNDPTAERGGDMVGGGE
jgi:hypothetical protein